MLDDGRLDFYEAFRRNAMCVEIFPNKIKFHRNERFVEKRVPRNTFRRNAMCVELKSYKNHKELYLKFLNL